MKKKSTSKKNEATPKKAADKKKSKVTNAFSGILPKFSIISNALNRNKKRPAKKKPQRRKTGPRSAKGLADRYSKLSVSLIRKKIKKRVYQEENLGDLTHSYDETKLVLLVRDPFWIYTYWDFSAETWGWIQSLYKTKQGVRPVLRVRNLNDNSFYDLDIQLETKNWYLNVGLPDTSFEAELGLVDASGRFYLIARSNRVRTPRNGPSSEIDPNWVPEKFDELYRLSGGGQTGHGSEIFSLFKKR